MTGRSVRRVEEKHKKINDRRGSRRRGRKSVLGGPAECIIYYII